MTYHLLYLSEKSDLMGDQDLPRILEKSQTNNRTMGVTGLLIKNGLFFIQLLEGKKETVDDLYNRIARDKRHRRIHILLTFKSEKRIFPDWSMGLVENDGKNPHLNELLPYLHQDMIKRPGNEAKVLAALQKFNHV